MRKEKIRLAVAAPAEGHCGIHDYSRLLTSELPSYFDVTRIDFPNRPSRGMWREAAAEADGADLLHLHFENGLFHFVRPWMNLWSIFLGRARPPVLATMHDLLPSLRLGRRAGERHRSTAFARGAATLPFLPWWERRQYGMVQRFLVHTEKHRDTVSLLAGRQRVVLARHPVPVVESRWEPERSPPCHLVSPGFVKAHKGYMRFLEVLARRPDWHWTVAGGPQDGADREFASRFEERVRLLGLGSRVLLTGYLPRREMERKIARARIALFPFDHSAGSGSLTWALGAAMPVVATDIDPVKELRKAGAGIALLDRESADSWAGEIDGLLGSPSALRSLAGKNRAYSLRNGYGRLAALVADVCRQILEETGGEAP